MCKEMTDVKLVWLFNFTAYQSFSDNLMPN